MDLVQICHKKKIILNKYTGNDKNEVNHVRFHTKEKVIETVKRA